MKKLLFFASAVAMLASCSKDLTADVAAPIEGNSKIYADYNVGNPESRTHAGVEGNTFAYYWDEADAIGVYANEVGDATNAMFKNTSTSVKGEFTGSLQMVAGTEYVAYYPYSPTTKYTADGITLNILANQNYNFDGGANGSFAQGAAPAIATGTAVVDENGNKTAMTLSFTPVASYIVVPIKGVGDKVKKLELEIGSENLAGEIVVDPNFEDLEDIAKLVPEDGGKTITLHCGDGVVLNKDKETYFWFVVPAGTKLTGVMKVTVTSEDGKQELTRNFTEVEPTMGGEKINATVRNYAHVFGPNATDDFFYNPTGAYIITNEYEFLMYADAATNGKDNVAYEVEAMWDEDDLRPAVIIKDLDFGVGFDTNPRLDDVPTDVADYLKKLLAAYKDNEKAIPTIGAGDNAVKFEIEGNVDGEAAEIKNLKVVGNGMFGGKAKIGNVVKNITLTNIEVEGDYLVTEYADAPVSMNQSTPFEKLEKITVNGGTIKSTNKNIAVVDKAYTRNLDAVKVNGELPAGAKYANTLYVSSNVNTPLDPALTFNTVKGVYSGKGKIVTVTAEGAKTFIDAIDVKASGANWFSVVEREAPATEGAAGAVKTSFWTGFVPADAPTGDVFTAEALAYAVKNRKPVVLTNDIDLMNGDWKKVADAAGYTSVNVNSKQPEAAAAAEAATTPAPAVVYTIKNVTLAYAEDDEYKPAHSSGYLSLFGYEAAVENIVVDGIVVDDANQPESVTNCYTAGLAHTGSAKNVTVKNAKINATKFSNSNKYHIEYTGVLFAYTESVENCTVVDSEVTGTKTIGYVAGLLGLTDKTVAEFKINGVKSGSNKTFGKIAVALPDNEKQTWTDVTFTDYAGSMAIEDFYVDGEKAHIIKLSINGKAGTLYTINPLAEEEEK